MREEVELTVARLGKDDLTEAAFMRLCETGVSHRVTHGTGHSIADLRVFGEEPLVLSNYVCQVTFPPSYRLDHFHLWDQAVLDVEVESFRWVLLDARCSLKHAKASDADPPALSFRSGLIFLRRDNPTKPGLLAPDEEALATDIVSMDKQPDSMGEFVKLKAKKRMEPTFSAQLRLREPIAYRLVPGRDVPAGFRKYSTMHCSAWVNIFDNAERELLLEQAPSLPKIVVDGRAPLDRLSYYISLAKADDELSIEVESRLDACPRDYHGDDAGLVSVGILSSVVNIKKASTGDIVVACSGRKLLLAPADDTAVVDAALQCVESLSRA